MNHVEEILKRSIEIHLKKRADYTTKPDENPYENFTRANELISWFPSEYKSFASHIGTKLARIASLLSNGNKVQNESLDDSFLDLVTYCALVYGYYKISQYPFIESQVRAKGAAIINGDLVTDKHELESVLNSLEVKEVKSTPNRKSEQCQHLYVNLNRRCGQCSKTIGWERINLVYQLDQNRDTYILQQR